MNRNGCPVKMAPPALQRFPEETVKSLGWNVNSSDFYNYGTMALSLKGKFESAFSVKMIVCGAR